jgi:protein gp37
MAISKISWTEKTWNPLTGCTRISPGCQHCYAEVMAKRLKAMGQPQYQNVIGDNGRWNGYIETVASAIEQPLHWKKPSMIFVNSMSDLFHKNTPLSLIKEVFDVMTAAHWHTFQILTKRAETLEEMDSFINWPDNVWMGVSVENNDYVYRLRHLKNTGAKVKFVSFEPLLEDIRFFDLHGIDWAIVGGESGSGCRPFAWDWARKIQEQCAISGTKFFMKQGGGYPNKRHLLDDIPVDLRVREWPR